MEFNKAKSTIKQRLKETFSKLTLNTVLAFSVLGLVIYINTKEQKEIIVPPHLSEKMEVGRNTASLNYIESIAFWLVGTISSVNQENADDIHRWTRRFFIDEIWSNLGPQILAIKSNPKFTGVNLMNYFSIKGIEYEPRTEIFYIYGKLTSAQYRKGRIQPVRSIYATYEVRMEMINGIPTVTHWLPYEGVPMTEEWKRKHEDQAKKRKAELEKTVEIHQTHPFAEEGDIIKEKEYDVIDVEGGKDEPPSTKESAPETPDNAASQIMKGIQPPEQTEPAPNAKSAQSAQDDLL